MSKGEGLIVKSLLPIGTHWTMNARLRERASQEREVFRSCVGLRIRRPGVVLNVEASGLLWLKDSWVRKCAGDCHDAA